MTTKEYIINYLSGKGWVNKGLIMQDIVEIAKEGYGYADTISRQLRKMRENGLLVDRPGPGGKGTEYCYIKPRQTWWSVPKPGNSLIETARKIRESKDKNYKLF